MSQIDRKGLTYDWNGHKDMPIAGGQYSDIEVACMVRMLFRDQLNHESVCVMARDRIMALSKKIAALPRPSQSPETFQQRIQPWMLACFGAEISADKIERNHRFLEEALELVQSTGCTASEAHQLVDYVYGRPVGETHQEIGGVMVTLAALCLAIGEEMHAAGETELARIWTKVEAIRAKHAAKPKHSPLPESPPQPANPAQGVSDAMVEVGARAIALDHYCTRFGKEPDAHIRDNVEGNWHMFADHFRIGLTAAQSEPPEEAEPAHLCPVCAVPFKVGDTCATDIELGMCHAACLEGSPTVDLDAGATIDGPIATYLYEADPAERPVGEPNFETSIAQVIEEEAANEAACGWRPCSGCHETNEGAETGHYPYSKTFGCYVGSGCSECGGIGVVWQHYSKDDLEAMASDGDAPSSPPPGVEAQITHMVSRFLNWKLPANFNPDGGISFKAEFNEHTAHPMKHEPVGTNLLDASQADAMVRHMLDGLPCDRRAALSQPQPGEPVAWRPIAEADNSIATVQQFGTITLRNSYPIWARDQDGRAYEAVWTDHKGGYWWDLDAESPVDPVEFLPHPLDPRFPSPQPADSAAEAAYRAIEHPGSVPFAEASEHKRDHARKVAAAVLAGVQQPAGVVEALQAIRDHFKVEYVQGGRPAVGYDSEALPKIIEILDAALTASAPAADGWLTMDSAPMDGTFVHVVARYHSATAGFPRYAAFDSAKGAWFEYSRFDPQLVIPWAWQPRLDWPSEPLPAAPSGGRG